MKKILLLSVALVTVALILSGCFMTQPQPSVPSYNLTGSWLLTITVANTVYNNQLFTITQTGTALTVMNDGDTYTGSINGNIIQFSYSGSTGYVLFTGTMINSNNMSGTYTITPTNSNGLQVVGTWSGVEES